MLQQSAQGTVSLLLAANLPQVVTWLRNSPESEERSRKILSSDLREHSESSPPVKESFFELEQRRRLLHCVGACARACLLLQHVMSEDNSRIPDGVLEFVHELVLSSADHLSNQDHIISIRKIVLARSAIVAISTVAAVYLNSTATQLSLSPTVSASLNPLPTNVLQAIIAICDRSRALIVAVPNISRSKLYFEDLRRNIMSSSPHIVPNLDGYTTHALKCNVSIPVVEMLVKTTNLMPAGSRAEFGSWISVGDKRQHMCMQRCYQRLQHRTLLHALDGVDTLGRRHAR